MSSATRVQAIRRRDLFFVQSQINDIFAARLLIDTGATLTVLSSAYARLTNLIDSASLRQETVITAQAIVTAPVIRLEKFQIGGLVVSNVEAAIIPLPEQLGVQGLLGASFLRHFRVTFEYDTNTVVFRAL